MGSGSLGLIITNKNVGMEIGIGQKIDWKMGFILPLHLPNFMTFSWGNGPTLIPDTNTNAEINNT